MLLVRRIATASSDRDSIVRWLRPTLLAIAGVVVGYLMFVPAGERYAIYAAGVQNRANCFAALGYSALTAVLLTALAAMLVAAVPRLSEGARSHLRAGLAALFVFGMLAVYTVRIAEDAHRWEGAAKAQTELLSAAHALVPSPPADSTIFTSPYPGYQAPSIPIFGGGGNNDELGAFKVSYDGEDLRAFPLLEGTEVECGQNGMRTGDAGNSGTAYGKALLLDFRAVAVYRPLNRRDCLIDAKAMMPYGPVNLTNGW
jgi:hypothetical protein